jgi:hypothetical protein
MNNSQPTLTSDQLDAIILAACTPADGAIEDTETTETEVRYFFESGAVGVVNRIDGTVTFEPPPV